MISLTCNCGRKLQVRDEFGGQIGQCPACGATLDIPPSNRPIGAPTGPGFHEVAVDSLEEIEPPVEAAPPAAGDEPLQNHGGDPVPADLDFFMPPPAEVGPLLSAWTTLREGQQPMSLAYRLFLSTLRAGVGLVGGLAVVALFGVRSEFWRAAWPLGLTIAGFGLTLAGTSFSHTCSYIGREGVARYVCSGSRDTVATREVFRFRDAINLRTSTTLHYRNSVYTHTSYSYTWTDINGQQRYTISGTHNSKAGTPPSGDAFHYARGAEIAWTMNLLEGALRQIELGSTVLFNLEGGQWVRLGQGVIHFSLGGAQEEWQAEDVRAAELKKGTVRILRHDAKEGWFSSSGLIKFQFDQLANAQLFFHLMEKVVGVPVM